MAMDIISVVVPLIAEYTVGPIKRHACYALYCESKFQNLKEEVDKLKNAKDRLQHSVDEEKRNGKVIEKDVANWLLEVDGVIGNYERELVEVESQAKKKCFVGLCPNVKTRYQLGKKAEKELAAVTPRLEEQASFGPISYRVSPSGMGFMSVKEYEAMKSRMSVIEEIMNALKVSDVNMIGVYGMGGMGKTTLVKEVARQAMGDKLFDKLIIATVTRNPDIMKIQGQIADQLGLTFDEESERGRASRLRERLKQEKKILVVLDDLWKRFDLEAVGISFKGEQKEGKILLTSREFDVLSSEMDVQMNFSLGALKEEEAWNLFKKMAAGKVDNPAVKSIAFEIAVKCAGLPVAIVTIAKALKYKSLSQWKDALQELKRPSPRNFSGVQGEVYSAIELSYKHLGNDELKSTFLLCSRMGYDASIEDLLKYGMGSGLFSDVATIEEARNRAFTLINKLKMSCLLLDSVTDKQFSIHDVVRDVAISIAFRDCNVFVKSDEVELKWKDKDSLKKCTEIWLHGNSIGFPEDLKYPLLQVFMMNSADPSLEIPKNIFRGMQKLRVLGLTNLSFPSLHSSLRLLKNLRSLCLHQSLLGEIAVIGELKKLEILSFVKSDVKHLPREIGQLTKLKSLDLTDCSELEVISPNVISSLSLLEELFMGNSFHHWDIGQNNASLAELEHLSHLTNLDLHIPDPHVLSKDLFSENLERYRIFIGDVWDWDGDYETSRTLKLKLNESADHFEHGIMKLLKRTEDLYLLELKGVKNIICELDREGFSHLKHLHLTNNLELQYIIDTIGGIPSNIVLFPELESLILNNLVSLEKIYHGSARAQSFCSLQTLEVTNCNKVKNLFSFSVARGLLQLQSITITFCSEMAQIVAEEFDNKNEAINTMELTQLRVITLQYLPLLRNFCSREKASCLSQAESKSTSTGMGFGEIILEDELQTPVRLFDEKIMFPNLEKLELSSINIERLWHGRYPSVQNLKRLDVDGCGSLKYIFPFSMVKNLLQLKELYISDCNSVEEIITTEALDEGEMANKMVFPKLENIGFSALPKLKRFCGGSLIECPLLKTLYIMSCPDFETFISGFRTTNMMIVNEAREVNMEENCHNAEQPLFDEKVVFPSLAEIFIDQLDNLRKIWHNHLAASSFSELRSLEIFSCNRLHNIFPSVLKRRFRRLEVLEIQSCDLLEAIFEFQGPVVEETHASDAFQLRDLSLLDLPKLKCIWNTDPQEVLKFQNLRTVSVRRCDALKRLFPLSIAQNLPQLEKLEIESCGVEEIIERVECDEGTLCFEFPKLTSLKLKEIPEFSNFCPGKHTWECPMLKSLAVSNCGNARLFGSKKFLDVQGIQGEGQHDNPIQQPLFFVEKVISNLEELSLGGKDTSAIIMSHCQLPADFYSKLKVLKLDNFKGKSNPIPFGFLKRLSNLETLCVESSSLKKLFLYEELADEDSIWTLAQFRNLMLDTVNDIRHLWEQDHRLLPLLSDLRTLEVTSCDTLVNLAPSTVSFENLTSLDVRYCNRLTNLVTSSTATSLVQLVKLTVFYCQMVTEIVAKQEDETEDEINFSKLEYLELCALESLTSFYTGNYTLKFPSLKEMVVEECPKMSIFSPGVLITPKLRGVCWQRFQKNQVSWQGNLNTTINQMYTEMVGFNGLMDLNLSDFPQLKEMWHGQLPIHLFSGLMSLTIEGCASVVHAMPSNLLQFMNNLNSLFVRNCDSLEGVFDLVGLNVTEGLFSLLPNLQGLELIDLPRLRHIGSRDPQGILYFKNLTRLEVHNCSSLKNIFTPSMALGLVGLQKIEVRNCAMMEEIITKEKAEEAAIDEITFPSLKVVVLESLPSLASIYSGCGVLEIPSLEEVSIDNCPKMNAFVYSLIREQEPMNEGKEQRPSNGDQDISTAPHLNHKIALGGLEKLKVEWNDIIKVIQHGQFRAEFFSKLKVLELVHFPDDYVVFPPSFLHRFMNLENFAVSDASFKEIVQYEERNPGKNNDIRVLAQLKELKLSKLPKLVHLSKEDSQPCQIFQHLETLEVQECGILSTLVTSSINFQSLINLQVSKCHGLINLMTSSTATSLVQLTTLRITECNMIEEIVSNNENEAENETVFHKLETLGLICLPSLSSFYSGHCALMFPCLKTVILNKCLKMKIFSMGVISTPKLEEVQLIEPHYIEYFEDDLNSTVQKLFMEMGDGAAKSNLPSSSKLTYDTSQDEKNGPSAVSGAQTSRDLHFAETTDIHKDLPPAFGTISGTNENSSKGTFKEAEIIQLTPRYQDFHATSSDMSEPVQVQIIPASLTQYVPVCTATAVEQPTISTATSLAQTTSSQEFIYVAASGTTSEILPVSVKEIKSPSAIIERLVKPSPASSSHAVLTTNSNAESRDLNDVNSENYGYSMALFKRILVETLKEVARSDDDLSLLSSLKNPPNPNTLKDLSIEVETTGKLELEKQAIKNTSIDPQSTWPGSTDGVLCATSNDKDSTEDLNLLALVGFETHICPQDQIDPSVNDKDELKQEQVMHASSVERSSRVPTSPAITVEQDPGLDSASRTKAYCSQELHSGTVSRQTQEVPTTPIIDRSFRIDTNYESLITSMEQLLNPSPSAYSQPASSSSTQAESQEPKGMSFETYSSSMSLIKRILMKSPTQVASSADRLLLLSSLMNLKSCPFLNPQQLEIIQVYIDNFDSLVTNNPSYEQQIDSIGALKLSIKDNKKRISELMNRYEDLTSKTSTLSATKESLKRKLREVEEDEAQTREDMEDIHTQLIDRKRKLETHMKVLPEAERQQRVAVDKASDVNDYWAKMRSLFA